MRIISALAAAAGIAALAACNAQEEPAENMDANLGVTENIDTMSVDNLVIDNTMNDLNATDNMMMNDTGNATDTTTETTNTGY